MFGPTSSGKTGLSLELAARYRAQGRRPVVLNADSRQVYRYLDIGTSKISRVEMRGVEHRLLDIVEPTHSLPLERYARDACAVLDDLLGDGGAVPIVVGGTGTYVRAVVDGWDLSGTSTTRRDLEREFPRSEVGEAHRMLKRIAPQAAGVVSPRDYEGTLNALVRAMHPDTGSTPSGFAWTVVAVDRKPADLERRVAATLDHQFEVGLYDEVKALDERYGLAEQFAAPGRVRTEPGAAHARVPRVLRVRPFPTQGAQHAHEDRPGNGSRRRARPHRRLHAPTALVVQEARPRAAAAWRRHRGVDRGTGIASPDAARSR